MTRDKSVFHGIIVAAVTPLNDHDQPDLGNLQLLLQTLYKEGVEGVLLLGTTGEGVSLSFAEQQAVLEAGIEVARDMIIMAGTGCASLPDTIRLTRRAFELGADACVTVPPFYFKKFTTPGLAQYYNHVLDEAVPEGKYLFLYDIPATTSVPITHDLIDQLLDHAEAKLGGVKDSTNDFQHTLALIQRYPQLRIFSGTDRHLTDALHAGAVGTITAGTNLFAGLAARIYHAWRNGQDTAVMQAELSAARAALERYTPFPPTLKSLLALRFHTSGWNVRPPLVPLPDSDRDELIRTLQAITTLVIQ